MPRDIYIKLKYALLSNNNAGDEFLTMVETGNYVFYTLLQSHTSGLMVVKGGQ